MVLHTPVFRNVTRRHHTGRLASSLGICLIALAPVLLTGCRAGDVDTRARAAALQPRFDSLAAALDQMQREQVLQQTRIAAAQKELAELREEVVPGVPRASVPPQPAEPAAAQPVTAVTTVKDPARAAATDRFLRNFAILCFTAFLVVAGAKLWRKRRQVPLSPEEPEAPPAGTGATVFHSRSSESSFSETASPESPHSASGTYQPPADAAEEPAPFTPYSPAPGEPASLASTEAEPFISEPSPESLRAETAREDAVSMNIPAEEMAAIAEPVAEPEPPSAGEDQQNGKSTEFEEEPGSESPGVATRTPLPSSTPRKPKRRHR